jgi:hypothetical protein
MALGAARGFQTEPGRTPEIQHPGGVGFKLYILVSGLSALVISLDPHRFIRLHKRTRTPDGAGGKPFRFGARLVVFSPVTPLATPSFLLSK